MIRQICYCNGAALLPDHLFALLRGTLCGATSGLSGARLLAAIQHGVAAALREGVRPRNDTSLAVAPGRGADDAVSSRAQAGAFPQHGLSHQGIPVHIIDYDRRVTSSPGFPSGVLSPAVSEPSTSAARQVWPRADGASSRCLFTRPRGVSPCLGHPLPSYHHRSLRTFRRDSDSDSDNDGPRSGSSPGRWPQKQYDRRGRRSSPDDGWDERIAGGGVRRGFDGPRDRHRPAWATSRADPEEAERRPSSRAAREDRGGGGGGSIGSGGGQRPSGRVLAEDWNRRAATDEEAAAAAAVPTGRRAQQAGAKDVGPVGPSLLVQLRTAGSWQELQRILNSVAPHPLSPREVATAAVTYCKFVNGVQAAAPPALAPAGLYDDHKHDYGRGVGGGTAAVGAREPPPPGLRERLQADLLATASAVPLRELSYCLFSLSMTPKAVSLLTESAVAAPGQVTEALVTRLEDVLYDKVLYGSRHRTLPTSKGKDRRLGGATAAAAAAAPGGGEDDGRQLVQCLTYLCTAVRRLRIARPSVHRALAAAAAPLLGRELAGEELAPLVIAFLGAGNPEPLFMEQLVHQSSLPYSLERTSSVFACTVLLRAAGQTGAERPVIDPLAARLCELLRESLLLKKQQEQLTEQHPPGDAVEAAGDAAGNADGDVAGDANGRSEGGGCAAAAAAAVAAIDPAEGGDGRSSPSSLPYPPTQPPTQQQLPGRRRPSKSDMQIVYVLQACAAAGLGPDSELVQLLVQEAKRQQSGWGMLHRLLTSRYFNALGINVVAPASAASPPPSAGATAASTAAAAATFGTLEQPQAEQRQQQQGQGRQQQQHLGLREEEREEEDLVLIREEELLDFLRQETMTLTSLLPVLYGLSQLRSRPHARGIGGGGAGAAADADEHDTADGDVAAAAAAAAPAAGHPNRMPTALGVAVQLVDAAAPLMAPKHMVRALSSLAAAGVVTPPSLLQRAEQLYKEQLASVGDGGGAAAAVDGEDAGGGLGGLDGFKFGADLGSVEGTAGTASVSQQRDAAVPNLDRGGGGGGGRSLAAMCAIVGRVLAWQPGGAAAAMLSDDFVRHCHDVAVDASRGGGRGRWLE